MDNNYDNELNSQKSYFMLLLVIMLFSIPLLLSIIPFDISRFCLFSIPLPSYFMQTVLGFKPLPQLPPSAAPNLSAVESSPFDTNSDYPKGDISDNHVTPSKNAVLVYENNTLGIKMQYPADWIKKDLNSGIMFLRYELNESQSLPDGISLIVVSANNMQINELTNQIIDNHKKSFANFNLVKSQFSRTIKGGYPAYLLLFTSRNGGPMSERLATAEVGVLRASKLYILDFFSDAKRFNSFLPIAIQTTNSIHISQ